MHILSEKSLHDPFLFLYSRVKVGNIVNNMVTYMFVIFDLDLIIGESAHAPSYPYLAAGFGGFYISVLKLKKKKTTLRYSG